jgi:hypothetical protein
MQATRHAMLTHLHEPDLGPVPPATEHAQHG